MNLHDLSEKFERRADEVERLASKRAALISKSVIANLVRNTPVDTSRAISNWMTSINKPTLGAAIEPHVFGIQGSSWSASASTTLNLAFSIIDFKKPNQSVYISNNTEYIMELETGSSTQAPAGFVEISILNAMLEFKDKPLGLK